MMKTTSTAHMSDEELVAWFADAGLAVGVVHRCPVDRCSVCDRSPLVEAA